jgi:hypothetical protein
MNLAGLSNLGPPPLYNSTVPGTAYHTALCLLLAMYVGMYIHTSNISEEVLRNITVRTKNLCLQELLVGRPEDLNG